MRTLVTDDQVDLLLDLEKQKKRKRVKNSSKIELGGVSKPLGGSDFVGDEVVVGGKLVQQDQIIDLTNQTMQFDKEKEKEKEQDKGNEQEKKQALDSNVNLIAQVDNGGNENNKLDLNVQVINNGKKTTFEVPNPSPLSQDMQGSSQSTPTLVTMHRECTNKPIIHYHQGKLH